MLDLQVILLTYT